MGRLGRWRRLFVVDWREWIGRGQQRRSSEKMVQQHQLDGEGPKSSLESYDPGHGRFFSGGARLGGMRRLLLLLPLHALLGFLSLLRYLIPRQGRPVRKKAVHELHHLSYLDALRGYLALVIFTGHTMAKTWKWLPKTLLRVPWLQFPFRGGFASLDIFFWISGYVITYRIIGFMQARRPDKALDALSSSIFRRYLRLFLPPVPVLFFTVMAVRFGLAIPPREKDGLITGNPVLWWLMDVGHMMNPFTHILGWWDGESGSKLIDPYWSLNAEFRSSMLLFTFCVGTCRMSAGGRKLVIWLCIPAFMIWQVQWASMAFLGMWFAECRQQTVQQQKAQISLSSVAAAQTQTVEGLPPAPSVLSLANNPPTPFSPSLSNFFERNWTALNTHFSRSRLREPFLYLLFLLSFVILMDPDDVATKTWFPHNVLNALTPEHWHPQTDMHLHLCLGAAMMLYPLDRLYPLQRPLLQPFSQYLGELSFGIYAVHFPVRWIVWEPRYIKWVASKYGNDYDTFPRLFPGYVGMLICVLWAADAFRKVDMRVVELCKYLETRMTE